MVHTIVELTCGVIDDFKRTGGDPVASHRVLHALNLMLLEFGHGWSDYVHTNVEQVLVADMCMMVIANFKVILAACNECDLLCLVLMLEENTIRLHLFRLELPENDDEQLLKLIRVPARVHRDQVGLTSCHAYLLLALNE